MGINNYYTINEKIRDKELRVIYGSENLGVLTKDEALSKARNLGLDLVIVSPKAVPPVAKILDFSKFLYDEKKKKAGVKGKKSELKEIRLRPSTDEGDLSQKLKKAKDWINEGNKVKISVVMKGRENLFEDVAQEKVNFYINGLSDVAKIEDGPKRLGTFLTATFIKK